MQAVRSSVHSDRRRTRWPERRLWWAGAAILAVVVTSGCKAAKGPAPAPFQPLSRALPPEKAEEPSAVASRPADVPTPLETTQPPPTSDDAPRRPVILQSIDFRILRIRAPIGTFSQSGKIWNPIDEEVVSIPMQRLLQRNGIRVGVGKAEDWPQIKAILDAERVEVVDRHKAVFNGLPLIIDLEQSPRDQTMFLYRADGTMPGASFPRSTNVLRLEYGLSSAEVNTVIVDVMPEIRMQRVDTSPAFDLNWPQPPPIDPPSRPFRELSVRLTIRPEHFLAIGPSAAAQRGYLAGSLLLCDEVDGQRFEALYVITPRVLNGGDDVEPARPK